jgi:hypothetical protein
MGSKMIGPRESFAEVLSNSLGIDMDERFMASVDLILIALWLKGYKIEKLDDSDAETSDMDAGS